MARKTTPKKTTKSKAAPEPNIIADTAAALAQSAGAGHVVAFAYVAFLADGGITWGSPGCDLHRLSTACSVVQRQASHAIDTALAAPGQSSQPPMPEPGGLVN